jgi:hypothetical protein
VSSKLDEKESYGPVSDYFLNQGYFVISGCEKHDIEDTSEFGLCIEGEDMRVDVAAARWGDTSQIETIAVECKRLDTMRRSLGVGLWQTTDYQVAFDKVFIATEASGEPGSKGTVIQSLGIGHICVDIETKQCRIVSNGDFRNKDRFDEAVWVSEVAPRFIMFLAFRDALGTPFRYGETFGGAGYIAQDMGGNVQYNCWVDTATGKSYFGVNIEHINSFRRILKAAGWSKLQRQLKMLETHRLTLTKDPVPGWRSATDVKLLGPMRCNEVNVVLLRKAIESVVREYPRRWRPHLTISAPLWTYDKTLPRETCIGRIKQAKEELSGVMKILVV